MGTYTYQKYRPSVDWEQSSEGLVVYMKENGIERIVDFDTYVMGVLGAILSPDCHEETIKAMTLSAFSKHGEFPVVYAGGVMSNSIISSEIPKSSLFPIISILKCLLDA